MPKGKGKDGGVGRNINFSIFLTGQNIQIEIDLS